MSGKLNIDEFVIDDVFDRLKHLEEDVSKKEKKKDKKNKTKDQSESGKMIINIDV